MGKISVIVPTYNERDNIEKIVGDVLAALGGEGVEVVVVDDDSPDGTGEIADRLSEKHPVKVVHRKDKKGLASAVVEGFDQAGGEIFAVIDADGSHPVKTLAQMLDKIKDGADLVFATRYVEGGGIVNWPATRRIISKAANLLARPLTSSTDPVSGYFMLKRGVVEGAQLNPKGFKIGLEVLVKGRYRKYVEIPYTFTNRKKGESKLGGGEIIGYLHHLMLLYSHKIKSSLR